VSTPLALEGVSLRYGRQAVLEGVRLRVAAGEVLALVGPDFARLAFKVQEWYGFAIGAMFAGVLGVGLYPLMGTRVWCRFGCPMAALLGLVQKVGRFRITVKKDMCISCGNCSTYCEMGIDVRSYAMANQSFTRASCVGCGLCSHVCPRGVLKLENKPDRFKGGTSIRVYAVDL
jgi:polyferredoxin